MDRISEWFNTATPTQKFLLVASGFAVLLMVFILLRPSDSSSKASAALKDSVTLTCQNPTCRNEIKTTPAEIKNYRTKHSGELFPCPKCGGTDLVEEGGKSSARPAPAGTISKPAGTR